MDESKWPGGFVPEPDLQGLEPLSYEPGRPAPTPTGGGLNHTRSHPSNRQDFRRDDHHTRNNNSSRGLRAPQGRVYGQTRYQGQSQSQGQGQGQGPIPGNNRRKTRVEY